MTSKLIGYARREGNRTVLERFGEALGENEVEISDDIVILKAEDAQKLLEPPRLDRLVITPERVRAEPERTRRTHREGVRPVWSPLRCRRRQPRGPHRLHRGTGRTSSASVNRPGSSPSRLAAETPKHRPRFASWPRSQQVTHEGSSRRGRVGPRAHCQEDEGHSLERVDFSSKMDHILYEGRFSVRFNSRSKPTR